MAMSKLIAKQHLKIKSPIVNINNHLNGIFPSFDSLNKKFLPDFCLANIFPDHYFFSTVNPISLTAQCNKLDNIYKESLINQDTIFIIADANIRNNVTTSVTYIQRE